MIAGQPSPPGGERAPPAGTRVRAGGDIGGAICVSGTLTERSEVEAATYRFSQPTFPAPACAGAARENYARRGAGAVRPSIAAGRGGRLGGDSDSGGYQCGSPGVVGAMA